MYNLYYYPHNASLAPHFILKELGVDYQLTLVDRKSNGQKDPKYMALNPTGRIPTLVDNGQAIFESAAICLHLAEQHPTSKLIPEIGTPERPLFHQWLMYLTNTLQAELMIYFYPENHTSEAAATKAIFKTQEQRITQMFELLDKELKDKEFLVGDHISVCDFYLLMLAIWSEEFEKPPMSFKHLRVYLRKLTKREAVQEVCAKEHISLANYL